MKLRSGEQSCQSFDRVPKALLDVMPFLTRARRPRHSGASRWRILRLRSEPALSLSNVTGLEFAYGIAAISRFLYLGSGGGQEKLTIHSTLLRTQFTIVLHSFIE